MQQRRLGSIAVSAIGLGCMGMAGVGGMRAMYGAVDIDEAMHTVHRALELGVNLFDTAEIYGPFVNEELLAKALRGRRDEAIISTKFGFDIVGGRMIGVNSRPAHIRQAVEASLKRLETDHVDILFQHRVDPDVPIEDVIATMAALKQEGKIRAIGLSEAGAETIRRAHGVHPIDVLQSEYSLWERTIEEEILPVCRELGIGLMPYSPLGRGFLSGEVKRAEELPADDYRRSDPRYQGENFDINMEIVGVIQAVAARHDASPAQIAIAWLLAQGDDIVPIPGCKRRRTLEDSVAATGLRLGAADLAGLSAASAPGKVAGQRYQPDSLAMVRL